MATSLRVVVRRLRQASASANRGLTDRHLLDRFVRDRDEAAFEVLVWRHGPTVLGVCRRALGNFADADDAFQAVFLTLMRRAAAVRNGDALAAWLCRVAFRISLRLRIDRRRRQHVALPEIVAAATPDSDAELKLKLDAEIDRLPEKFRRVFVLCYLHGQTTAEAAAILGCPRGTVLSRLAAARKRLRRRLTQRGLVPVAAFAAVAGAAWPSGELVAATVVVVKSFAVGAAVPRHIAALSQGVIRTMILNKVKLVAAVAVTVSLIGLGAGWLSRGSAIVANPQPPAKTERAADPPKSAAKPTDAKKPDSPPDAAIGAAAAEEIRKKRREILHEQLRPLDKELFELNHALLQHTISVRKNTIEIEERIRLTERLRENQRKSDVLMSEQEVAAREENHMSQIVELRQRLVKIELERSVDETEAAMKREWLVAQVRAISDQIRELEFGAPHPTSASELERRISTLERELAELRRRVER